MSSVKTVRLAVDDGSQFRLCEGDSIEVTLRDPDLPGITLTTTLTVVEIDDGHADADGKT